MTETKEIAGLDFVRQGVADWLQQASGGAKVITRFPPEPNGYLHIGHAKSICLNFGISEEFGGCCFLRFDDTNPLKEDQVYVDAITRDVKWLGFDWDDRLSHASDYYPRFFDYALQLIEAGLAYVDGLSPDEIRDYRGTLTEPGKDSPYRNRSIDENLQLFKAMQAGKYADGELCLRARIDMASPNINLRDPILYRIRKVDHQRTGSEWCIYPMYDFAHPISDALEGITHSLCTLEFEDHRPLYDWVLQSLQFSPRPQQIEFSRLNLAYTVTSKRKLAQLIDAGHVADWDDPRMPTIAGMRRRGYTPASIRDFCGRIGVTKKENIIQMGVLENSVREDLGEKAPRVMAVLDPIKVTLTNWPGDRTESLTAQNHPGKPEMGERELLLTREIYIERSDFMEDPPRKFFRLRPDGEVRLRYGYIIKCEQVVKDEQGVVVELLCSFDPDTRSGEGNQRKVKGTIHWVSVAESLPAEVRLYDRLFTVPRPDSDSSGQKFTDFLNPQSLQVLTASRVEKSLVSADSGAVQFERTGYFVADSKDSTPSRLVFNRVVTLRDSWAKLEKQQSDQA